MQNCPWMCQCKRGREALQADNARFWEPMNHAPLGLDVKVDDVMCVQKCQPGRNVERKQAPLAIPAKYALKLFNLLITDL